MRSTRLTRQHRQEPNPWVQTMPGCASCLFLSQRSGAPDIARWEKAKSRLTCLIKK
jgi:hypothetical protein